MTNYAQRFPRCDDCPMMLELQMEREQAAQKREERTIARMLDIVQSEHEVEEIRKKCDIEYARILDGVSAGYIAQDDPDVEIAGHIYSKIVTVIDRKDKMQQQVDEYLAANDLDIGGEIIDQEAEVVAANCPGARYRRKTVFCSSWMSNIINVQA